MPVDHLIFKMHFYQLSSIIFFVVNGDEFLQSNQLFFIVCIFIFNRFEFVLFCIQFILLALLLNFKEMKLLLILLDFGFLKLQIMFHYVEFDGTVCPANHISNSIAYLSDILEIPFGCIGYSFLYF